MFLIFEKEYTQHSTDLKNKKATKTAELCAFLKLFSLANPRRRYI